MFTRSSSKSAVQAERVAKLGVEIRHERERIASLRAEWAKLDNPARIQALAQRFLALKPLDPAQIEGLDHLPERTGARRGDGARPVRRRRDGDADRQRARLRQRGDNDDRRIERIRPGRAGVRGSAGPWHRRMFQSLLYGRNVDRARKARARLGLAMVGFAVIYAIIAGRLVLYAVVPDTRAARHGA